MIPMADMLNARFEHDNVNDVMSLSHATYSLSNII